MNDKFYFYDKSSENINIGKKNLFAIKNKNPGKIPCKKLIDKNRHQISGKTILSTFRSYSLSSSLNFLK